MVDGRIGVELTVHGIVQGVGFRPFVHKLAVGMELNGTVTNSGDGVIIRLLCSEKELNLFIDTLNNNAPPLARITSIAHKIIQDLPEYVKFTIDTSISGPVRGAMIPPDIALCNDCLSELTNQNDRRYNYPFINCTNCGPRFTIVETIPYDRPKTSMKQFTMCNQCAAEYHNPEDRRFHAQPNACFDCGPHLTYHHNSQIITDDPIDAAIQDLCRRKIVAIRGLGGFHLAVDGTSDTAVAKLRSRKGRPAKPLAIMVADIQQLGEFTTISPEEQRLLSSPQHPIVLLPKPTSSVAATNLAPGLDEIGVMLPYTPFHHLLFNHPDCPQILVMTSGNLSGEPICTSSKCAFDKLNSIANSFLLHNRDIVTRVDDSVAKVMNRQPMILRRARGYVPSPISLSDQLPQVLACGGGLKSTFCLTRDRFAFLSQHIGDLFNLESLNFFSESVEHLQNVLEIKPELVACDLHPDYLSSHFAEETGLPLYKIQHHHAHAVAVMAEHGLTNEVLAVILDGTGYGPDGTIWGGEILTCDCHHYQRQGHFSPLPMPGGDVAASEPYRMALAALRTTFGPESLLPKNLPPALTSVDPKQVRLIGEMIQKNINCPITTSCGRLFDAAAGLLGVRKIMSYEGQAAMELESLAWRASKKYNLKEIADWTTACKNYQPLLEQTAPSVIATQLIITCLIEGITQGFPADQLALQFHLQLIGAVTDYVEQIRHKTGLKDIVLSGGSMQNRMLLEGLTRELNKKGFSVYTGSEVPINDGGISLGQAVIGGFSHVSSNTHASHQH